MCRQIEIKTQKATLLAVELPEGAYFRGYFKFRNKIVYHPVEGKPQIETSYLPQGSWQHIGTLDQMTEEVWKGIVDQKDKGYGVIVNKDYVKDRFTHSLFTATESGLSLLEVNGVMFENPLGEKPQIVREKVRIFGTYYEANRNAAELDKWNTAQSKLFDPNRTHFFIKQD